MLQTLEIKTLTAIVESLCKSMENDLAFVAQSQGSTPTRLIFSITSSPITDGIQLYTEANIHLGKTCLFKTDLVTDEMDANKAQVLVTARMLADVFGYGISNAINTINQRAALAPSWPPPLLTGIDSQKLENGQDGTPEARQSLFNQFIPCRNRK